MFGSNYFGQPYFGQGYASGDVRIAVSDSIATSENCAPRLLSFVNVNDSSSTSEGLTVFIQPPNPFLVISDNTTPIESCVVDIQFKISVSDSSSVAESTSFNTAYPMVVSEAISVSENVVFGRDALLVNVSELSSVVESVGPINNSNATQYPGALYPGDNDVEVVFTLEIVTSIRVSDSTSISEDGFVDALPFNTQGISVVEHPGVTENIGLVIPAPMTVSDSAHIAELVIMLVFKDENISVFDTVTTSEHIVGSTAFGILVTQGRQQIQGVKIV